MSETTPNNATEQQEKELLKIKVDSHAKFASISDTMYLTSVEFCETVSSLFRNVYADWEGCKLAPLQGINQIQMLFYFNHREQQIANSNLARACTRDENSTTKSSTLAALRHRDHLLANGDSYHLTEDGMSSIRDFLYDNNNLYKRNGEVEWKKIVAEASDYTAQGYGQAVAQQLTQVSWIDPVKLATLIYGENDDTEGSENSWVYNIRVLRSMPSANYSYGLYAGNNQPQNYMLAIDRISSEETKKLAALYGLVLGNGLGIVR